MNYTKTGERRLRLKSLAVAGQGLDRAIGVAIMEIAQTKGLDTKLISTIQAYILPAQERWRKALAKAEGEEV